MKKSKKILVSIGVVLAITTFLALFLPFFINVNEYKPKIQDLVSKHLNAKLDFEHAQLSLFGRLSIKFRNVSLENNQVPFAGQKIFSGENIEVQIDFVPLIFSHKIISVVYLDNPTVNIIKIGNQDNISSLLKPQNNQIKDSENDNKNKNEKYSLALNEFNVNHADIIFKDLTNKASPITVKMQDINLDMIRENQIVNITKLNMKLFSGQLSSHIKIDLSNPQIAYSGDCTLKNFSLSDIYNSFAPKDKSPITGVASTDFTFDGRGITKEVYSKALNGKGNFKIKSGELKIDASLPGIFDQLSQFFATIPIPGFNIGLSRKDLENAQKLKNTIISLQNGQGNYTIDNGIFKFKNNLTMNQGILNADISIGVFTSVLKGTLIFTANDSFTKSLINLNKNFSYLLDKNNQIHLKIYLSGTIGDPVFKVDTDDILPNVLLHTTKSILNPIQTVPNAIKDTLKTIFNP